jgi:hypothetical protein
LLSLWVLNGRSLSLALDRLHTVPIESQAIAQIGLRDVSGGMLRLNDIPFSTVAPDNRPYPVEMRVDAMGSFIVQSRDRTIVLGRTDGSLGAVLKPAGGDKARLRIDRGLVSWPTPFETNFMTGASPSWRRHLYYRFSWKKADGRELLITWRYEQPYYQGWASGFMTHEGTTGLIGVDIRP